MSDNPVKVIRSVAPILNELLGTDLAWTNLTNATVASLDVAIQRLAAVLNIDGSNIFSVSMDGQTARTDLDALLTDLATLLATRATAAATDAVTTSDGLMAYVKQIVTILYRLNETAIADTSDPVDMTTEVADDTILANQLTDDGNTSDYDRRTDSQEAISDSIATSLAKEIVLHTVIRTEDEFALKNTNLDVFELDAIAGVCRNVVIEVYLELDGAATYTPVIKKTDELNVDSYTDQLIPALATIATPAAAGRYRYEAGDLQQGHRCIFNLAQDNNGDANHDVVAVMTYEQ